MGFRVSGFFLVSGLQGFRVSGFMAEGFQGFRVLGFQGFRGWELGCWTCKVRTGSVCWYTADSSLELESGYSSENEPYKP